MENPNIKWFGGTPHFPPISGKLQIWFKYAKMWLNYEQVGFSSQACFFLLSDMELERATLGISTQYQSFDP